MQFSGIHNIISSGNSFYNLMTMSMVATRPQYLPMKFGILVSEQQHQAAELSMFKRDGVERWLIDILFEVNQLTIRVSINFHSVSANEGLLVLGQLSSELQRLLQPSPTASMETLVVNALHADRRCYTTWFHHSHHPRTRLYFKAFRIMR
jgi:hypothetical protein